ncbi:hypothetical protein SEA_JACKIEB_8 [Streptomyces phage JackieB]|nr:hypothetical protein SEA_JACKIEB_8 [Streptomyces phage JackieB]
MGSQAPLGTKDLFDTPGAELPGFVREVARALMRNGKSKSNAIQIAIGQIKKWAAGGGGVNADTQAKAARALAQWEAAKAKAHATPNKSDHSNPVYAPGQRVIFLANDKKAPAKKGGKKEARDGDKGKLPPGATGWKHGWIPVDDSGKAVGPAQKPKWLLEAEAKHKAAGGRTAEEIEAEKLKNAQDARQRKAEAPAKKAKAEKERKEREAEAAKKKAEREKAAKTREAERKTKDEERAKTAKAKEKERQIQAAYRQALADRKNGRELSEQQRRVVAYVEAKERKEQGKLRRVDVPGADGSSVAKTAPAKKGGKVPTTEAKKGDGKTVKRPAKPAVRTAAQIAKEHARAAAKRKRDARYSVRSYKAGRAPQTRNFSNDGVNVLEFAGKNPAGQLAFRYKHGWILINPAIPSRGHMGGAIARKHGVKSGSVTHGHFVDAGGGKKKFVPTRHGGENNPAKLKAAHTKRLQGAPADKTKYGLTAAMKDTGGNALKPSVPSAEKVSQVSKDANDASAKANASKSLQDAQVAAKKHADAFVQAKKAGDTKLADSHKANAQAWAKKAQQIKQAEKASADAKAKYEAEQKAKAKADAEAAEKAKAEAEAAAKAKKVAAQKKALDIMDDAGKLSKLAEDKPEKTVPELKAKAQQHKYAADKWQELADHQQANGFTVGPQLQGKIKEHEEKAADYAKKAVEKKKAIVEAQQLAVDAYDASDDAAEAQTAEDYQIAAHAHQKAGKAFQALGMTTEHTMHFDKASQLMKQYHKAAAEEEAQKKAAEKKPDLPPNIAKADESAKLVSAIGNVLDEIEDEPGSLGQWDDYLHAAYNAKKNPSAANLAKLAQAQKALTQAGVSSTGMQQAGVSLFKKTGLIAAKKTAAKKTVAQKKTAAPPAKKTAAPPAPAPAPDVPVPTITLPGPGMYADGNAITKAKQKADAMPPGPQKDAQLTAVSDAMQKFKEKHGKPFDISKVEVMPNSTFVPTPSDLKQHPAYADAIAAGFTPVNPEESANGGWKPSQVPGLKSSAGAYHYSGGSYTDINAQLRKYKSATGGNNDAAIAQMDKEFAAVPPLTQGIVTTRRMSDKGPFPEIPPPMEPGAVYMDHGYSSTSKDPGVWSGSVVMEVRIPAGARVLDLNHTTGSQHSNEKEILLNRGSKYKIVSDGKVAGERRIVVELVTE